MEAKKINHFSLFLFRITFAITGILFCLKSIEFIPLRWDSDRLELIYILHFFWIGILLLMFLGIGGRVRNLIHFILSAYLLYLFWGSDVGSSIQESIYMLPCFWMMFIDDVYLRITVRLSKPFISWNKPDTALPAFTYWALWGFGFNWGLILLNSATCKLFDPFWSQGTGFYFTLYLPFVKPGFLNSLLNHQGLLTFLNYGAEFIQLSFLLFFLLPRTRFITLISLIAFFGGLIFPLRLDFIGEIGITYLFIIGSVTHYPFKNWNRFAIYVRKENAFSELMVKTGTLGFSLLALLSFLFISFDTFNSKIYDYKIKYAIKPHPKDIEEIEYRNGKPYKVMRYLTDGFLSSNLNALQHVTVCMQNWAVFTSVNERGLYEYRVIIQDEKGRESEPLKVFNNDMTGGPYILGFTPRYMHTLISPVSILANKLSVNPHYIPSVDEQFIVSRLIDFCAGKTSSLSKGSIYVRKVELPMNFEGDSRLYKFTRWELLCEKGAGNSLKWSAPSPFKLQCIVPGLPNYYLANKEI